MRLEEPRHLEGVGGHPLDAQAHGLEPLDQHPRVERAHTEPGVAHEVLHRTGDVLLGPQDGAAEDAALTVDVLGRGVHHHVRAQLERLLVQDGGEDVVHHDLRAGRVGQLAHRADVDQLLHGVGGGLEEDGVGGLGQRLAPLVEVGAVDEHRLHAPARQDLRADHVAGAEQRAGGHEPGPVAAQCGQRHEHRGHAGAGGEARLGALDLAQSLLEHRDGGVAVAGVDEALLLAVERRLSRLGGLVHVAGVEEHRLGGLLEGRAHLAGADPQGVGVETFGELVVLHPLLSVYWCVWAGRACVCGGAGQDWRQARPATFQPLTVPRCPSASGSPSKPPATL